MWKAIAGLASGVVSPITKVLETKTNAKAAVAKAKIAAQEVKDNNETKVKLSDREWETISKRMEGNTLKDEFVTIILLLPIALLSFGALFDAFGFPQLLIAGKESFNILNTHLKDYGQLILIVTLAALGFKSLTR